MHADCRRRPPPRTTSETKLGARRASGSSTRRPCQRPGTRAATYVCCSSVSEPIQAVRPLGMQNENTKHLKGAWQPSEAAVFRGCSAAAVSKCMCAVRRACGCLMKRCAVCRAARGRSLRTRCGCGCRTGGARAAASSGACAASRCRAGGPCTETCGAWTASRGLIRQAPHRVWDEGFAHCGGRVLRRGLVLTSLGQHLLLMLMDLSDLDTSSSALAAR